MPRRTRPARGSGDGGDAEPAAAAAAESEALLLRLPSALLVTILRHLDTRERLACLTACRALYELRSDAGLWRELALVADSHRGLGPRGVHPNRFARLLRFVGPAASNVAHLTLGGDRVSAAVFEAVLDVPLPSLLTLRLYGQHAGAAALRALARNAAAASLQALLVDDVELPGPAADAELLAAALDVVRRAPRLASLALPCSLGADAACDLGAAAAAAAAAAGARNPALVTLDLWRARRPSSTRAVPEAELVDGAVFSDAAHLSVAALAELGRALPWLEELSVWTLSGLHTVAPDAPRFAPLPHLRRFHVRSACHSAFVLSDDTSSPELAPPDEDEDEEEEEEDEDAAAAALGVDDELGVAVRRAGPARERMTAAVRAAVARLVQAAPALEELKLVDCVYPLGAALAGLPPGPPALRHLRALRLRHCKLRGADFTALGALPALRVLRLHGCEHEAIVSSAAAAAAAAPALEELSLFLSYCGEPSSDLEKGLYVSRLSRLDTLTAPALRTLTIAMTTPREADVRALAAGLSEVAARAGVPALCELRLGAFYGGDVELASGRSAAAAGSLRCFAPPGGGWSGGGGWPRLRTLRLAGFAPAVAEEMLAGADTPALREMQLLGSGAQAKEKEEMRGVYRDARARRPELPPVTAASVGALSLRGRGVQVGVAAPTILEQWLGPFN